VRRLLEGKPTIFQVGENIGDDSGFMDVTHYLIDRKGVYEIDKRPSFVELRNANIWVLADQIALGAPRQVAERNWLVVLTSSPREANYKYIVKEYSPGVLSPYLGLGRSCGSRVSIASPFAHKLCVSS